MGNRETTATGTSLAGRRCLVTGGAGFIGSHLVEGLLQAGAGQVRVLDNFANGKRENLAAVADDPRLSVLARSVLDEEAAAVACRDVDVVFHLACLGVRHSLHAPMANHRVNAEGTLIVLEAARRANVGRFVYVSSSEVYGTARYAPMDEDHPTRPTTVYGAGKLAGESYARAYFETYGLPTVMARPFNNFGPRSHFEGDAGEVIPRFIVRALGGRALVIFGDGTQTRDFIHVSDTVLALLAIATDERCVGKTLNIGRGEEISVSALADVVLRVTGQAGQRPSYEAARPGDVLRLCADTGKLRSLIDFTPRVSFAKGLAELVAWFRSHPEAVRLEQPVRNWETAGGPPGRTAA